MKIGIIGCGKIVRFRHGPECAASQNIELAGFCDFNIERAKELSEEFGGKAYANADEMLSDMDVDGVIVCSSNKTHAELTVKALKAGKHVLCEKPMCVSLKEALWMEKTAKECGRLLMIGHNQRLDYVHMKAKELLGNGVIGRVLSFKTEFTHSGPEAWSIDSKNSWFFNKDEAFVGAMGDLGVHKIDLIRWLLEDDISEVNAKVVNIDKKDEDGNPVGIDDWGIYTVSTKKGVYGTITSGWCNYGVMDNSTTIYGTKGVMTIWNPQAEYPLLVSSKEGTKHYEIPTQKISGVVDAFADAVIGKKESPISGEEGVACMKVVMAALESSQSKVSIHIS